LFELKLENDSANVVDINDGEKYVVLAVSGLNPPPASIFTAKSPNRKGVKYNGSTLGERNIVCTIKILGDVEKNRNDLYAWIDTEQYCKVYYRNGTKNVFCEGHIQDCDIDMFTDNEVISLAILCENPYWKDLQEISADISALLKQFTFPFAIDAAGIPFSTMRENNSTNVFNAGAETGVKITVKCKGTLENLLIYNANDTSKRFTINYTFPPDWVIVIDTENSPKTVKAIAPDGEEINMLKYVGNNPTWFTLKKGNNLFGYTADSGAADAEITIGFRNLYSGV
jgi:hypothetical protein